MDGRRLIFVFLGALLVGAAPAGLPAKLAPVLPEVHKHLIEGRRDIDESSFSMARAHAYVVLLGADLKIKVQFQAVPKGQRDTCLAVLKSAMNEWEQVLDHDIKLSLAADDEKSDVLVRFRPSVVMKDEQVAGYVNWKRSIDSNSGGVASKFTADLQIRVRDLDGRPMPAAAMRHAAMHELGHVLGLDDSPHQGDVMGPLDIDNPVDCPTALEVETVRAIRAEAEQILADAR